MARSEPPDRQSACHRCNEKPKMPGGWIMSMFNTEMICRKCKEEEQRHPRYEEACEAEWKAHRAGNHNFNGIGKPEDL